MTERVQKWDILKFILMFLVVLGHIIKMYIPKSEAGNYIAVVIYTFHMPVFLFISGLFSKRTVAEKRYTSVFSYFVLYLLMKLVMFIFQVIFYNDYSFSLLSEREIPWYPLALGFMYLITIAVRKLPKVYVFVLSIILACFVGYDSSISTFLVLSRTIVFYPFFFAGYCFDAKRVNEWLSKPWVRCISVAVIIVFLAVHYIYLDWFLAISGLCTGQNPFNTLGQYERIGGIIRFVYYIAVFIIGAAVISLTPSKTPKGIVARLGSRSVQAYVLHKPLLDIIYFTFGANGIMKAIYPSHPKALIFPLALIVTIICSLKIFEPVFNLILKPKNN